MDQILYQYEQPALTTWIYFSSLLTIAIFFKFNRVWSLRNLDLLGLIALAPGLYMVEQTGHVQFGYVWLFCVSGCFLIRMLADPMLVRRPLLEPNLSTGGMTFIGICLLLFLTVNVLTKNMVDRHQDGPRLLEALLSQTASPDDLTRLEQDGPGHPVLHVLPSTSRQSDEAAGERAGAKPNPASVYAVTTRSIAIASHLAMVLGMVLIGVRHFDNIRTGIAAATLYMMLPYAAEMTGRVDHVLPAALLVWAIVAYRRPMISGMLLGLATGTFFYPLFLLPLWMAFYWQRGLVRFGLGFVVGLGLMIGSLAFTAGDPTSLAAQIKLMLGWSSLSLEGVREGFWALSDLKAPYRFPVMVGFAAMAFSFALWPAQKNLGTLLSCSTAVMLGTQFWHAQAGGLYMAWYLPLLLLTIFRPNLEDRVAVSTLGEGWWTRRKSQLNIRAA